MSGALSRGLCALSIGLVLSGCGDRCQQLCQQTANRLATCKPDSLAWVDVGATSRNDFASNCRSDWDAVSVDLTLSDRRLALETCDDTARALSDMTCDEITALYAPTE